MHSRYRSPGNGYRSNSMEMSFSGSRMSQTQDASGKGHGFYNSEYRPFNNRGFYRSQGRPKSFQQPLPQPPPTQADILMEAGRLATEYLVSKGTLPRSALTSKWKNGNFKKQVGDHQDFRQQDAVLQDCRTSAHARLRSSLPDTGLGRRRYPEEVNSRNHIKGRRRGDYCRSDSSEWGREYGRSSSGADKSHFSPDMDSEDNNGSGFREEQQVVNSDVDSLWEPDHSGFVPARGGPAYVELGQEKRSNSDELGSKATSSNAVKDENDWGPSKGSSHVTNCKNGNEEMRESISDYQNEENITLESLSTQHCPVEDDLSTKNGSDLLSLCMFAKIPTKTRSALTSRVSKLDLVDCNEESNPSNIGLPNEADALDQDGNHYVSTGDAIKNANLDSAYPVFGLSNLVRDQAPQNDTELANTFGAGQGKCLRSQSFPDRSLMHDNEEEANLGLSGLVRSSSVKELGEKRAAEDGDKNEATKKPREWFHSLVTEGDKDMHLSNLNVIKVSLQDERVSSCELVCPVLNGDSMGNNSQFAEGGEICINYAQEKKLFPGSFKICDLNLMEASDVSDSHHSEQVLMYPSLAATEKSAAQIDVELSISNSTTSDEFARCMNDSKEIEVIDLENDSTTEESAFNTSHRKMETAFASTGGFPSKTLNASEMTDVQDLMMSELLNNFSSCTAVPDDMNRLQSAVGLHNGEGTLGDDDSIYMSLDEIPLSFIPAWEQPTPQEYEKPF